MFCPKLTSKAKVGLQTCHGSRTSLRRSVTSASLYSWSQEAFTIYRSAWVQVVSSKSSWSRDAVSAVTDLTKPRTPKPAHALGASDPAIASRHVLVKPPFRLPALLLRGHRLPSLEDVSQTDQRTTPSPLIPLWRALRSVLPKYSFAHLLRHMPHRVSVRVFAYDVRQSQWLIWSRLSQRIGYVNAARSSGTVLAHCARHGRETLFDLGIKFCNWAQSSSVSVKPFKSKFGSQGSDVSGSLPNVHSPTSRVNICRNMRPWLRWKSEHTRRKQLESKLGCSDEFQRYVWSASRRSFTVFFFESNKFDSIECKVWMFLDSCPPSVAVLTNIWFVDTGNGRLFWATGAQKLKRLTIRVTISFMWSEIRRDQKESLILIVDHWKWTIIFCVVYYVWSRVRSIKNDTFEMWNMGWISGWSHDEKNLYTVLETVLVHPGSYVYCWSQGLCDVFLTLIITGSTAIVSWKRYQTNCFWRRPFRNLVKVPLFWKSRLWHR